MIKIAKQPLGQLVIASSLFASFPSYVLGATTISTPTVTAIPFLTSVYGDITIASTGSITNPVVEAIRTDTAGAIITVDPNNTTAAALNTSIGPDISMTSTGALITIGAGSTITGPFNVAAQAGSSGGVIINNGIMTATGPSIAVTANSNIGSVTNNGTITAGGPVVSGASPSSITGNIVNTGTMTSTGSNLISLTGTTMGGNINNSGTMTAPASVIFLNTNTSVAGGIINSGSMSSSGADVILAQASSTVGPITNSGTITASGANNAINLSAITTSPNVLITNNAPGVITGNVLVSNGNTFTTVLQMNGGTINGTVRALAGNAARNFNVTGGTITGGIDLSATAGWSDSIVQSGGTVGPIIGNLPSQDTYTVTGPVTTGGNITAIYKVFVPGPGDLTVNHFITAPVVFDVNTGGKVTNNGTILGGPSGALTVTGASSFINTSTGFIDIQDATISDAGSVFSNSGITSTTNLTIQNNALFIASGTGTSTGTLTVNSNATYLAKVSSITSVFGPLSINNSTYEVEIQDPSHFGQIVINGPAVSNITNSIVKVDLPNFGSHLFQDGEMYPIIHNAGAGTITHSFTIVQPPLATIKFIDVSTNKDIILEVERIPFSDLTCNNDITLPVALTIDSILNSGQVLTPEFEQFIIALDSLTACQISDALETVVPQFDGGLVRLSQMLQHTVFGDLGKYIDEHRGLTSLIPGYVAGDVGMGRFNKIEYSRGSWAKAFASRAYQKDQGISDGYDLEDIGVILGYDQYCSDRVVLGGALSYATGNIYSKAISADQQSVKSFQLTAYSTYDYKGPGYVDIMAAVAFNNYDSTRNIIAGSFLATSTGEFTAWNYGVNLEAGYRFSQGKYRIIPVARFLYSRLQIDNYTEEGAGGLSLSVLNQPVEEGITAIGIKFNSTNYYQEAAYVPEIRFNVIYDWINDGQVMTSNFLEGGPPFVTNAIIPHPCIYNLGISLTALASENLVFVINYDLDLQRDYAGHNVGMKFRYEW